MALLIDDSFAALPLAEAVRANLVPGGFEFALVPDLKGTDVGADDSALIQAGDFGHLQETHKVAPHLAVVFDRTAPVALRTPIRPDGIERTPIQLVETGSSAELLARATLDPFFGITPAGFYRETVEDAEAMVVSGAMALLPPEAGFSEDLGKAWYILTEAPVVSHILVVPKASNGESDLAFAALKLQAETSRRAIRGRIAEATGVDKEALLALYQQTRFSLADSDRRALLLLLQLGNRLGEVGPYVSSVEYV
jgi:hypothetical protein